MKCKTGKKLIHQWAEQVQHAGINDWQSIMFGKREYDRHAKKCKVCRKGKK